jgi:hypothetical protein
LKLLIHYLDVSQWGEIPKPPLDAKPGTIAFDTAGALCRLFGLEFPVTERRAFTVAIEPDDWIGGLRG